MAGGAKTADKMIKWNGSILWISGDVEIFASIGLIFTHWYQVIGKVRFDESGTGSRVKGNLRFIPRPLKELTFLQLRVSTLHSLFAYFTIMVHLPNNFLKPGCSCGNDAIKCDLVVAISWHTNYQVVTFPYMSGHPLCRHASMHSWALRDPTKRRRRRKIRYPFKRLLLR